MDDRIFKRSVTERCDYEAVDDLNIVKMGAYQSV